LHKKPKPREGRHTTAISDHGDDGDLGDSLEPRQFSIQLKLFLLQPQQRRHVIFALRLLF
jgi:hypothetical protein